MACYNHSVPEPRRPLRPQRRVTMKRKALLMAVLTTVLWSGSYIVNKLAFQGGAG